MPTPESDDAVFLQDLEIEFDDDRPEELEQAAVAADLFSEASSDITATDDLHGQFEGDLRVGLMARIATGGAIKE